MAMDLVPYSSSTSNRKNPNLPWSEMFRSASSRQPPDSLPSTRPSSPPPNPNPKPNPNPLPPQAPSKTLTLDPDAKLALHIAMAHACLALSLLLLYGLYRLLHSFLRPLQWALLCSIPLRQLHQALLHFWAPPLSLGVLPTILALPSAALRSSAATLSDLRLLLLRRGGDRAPGGGFSRLLRWLATFWLFLLSYEHLGLAAVAVIVPSLLLAGPTASAVRNSSFANRRSVKGGAFLTSAILKRLETIIAVGLMVGMIVGALAGGAFFSYKIAVEGKDAVVSLKEHVENSNYAEKIGFKKWIEENDVPGLVDQYSVRVYETVWDQVDQLAVQYNLTEFSKGLRHFLIAQSVDLSKGSPTSIIGSSPPHPYSLKLQSLTVRAKNGQWGEIYNELDSIFRDLLVTRVNLVEKAK